VLSAFLHSVMLPHVLTATRASSTTAPIMRYRRSSPRSVAMSPERSPWSMNAGNSVCLNDQASGAQVCPQLLVLPGAAPVTAGQDITATRVVITSGGVTQDTLVLVSPAPTSP
jgi:hypothetical protein